MSYPLQPEVQMVRQVDLDGAAHLVLPPGVRHPDEPTAVFDAMDLLRARPGWTEATRQLRAAWTDVGQTAQEKAANYGLVFQSRRGSMIVDVVASRRRKYETRVQRIVEAWQNSTADRSLAGLVTHRPDDRKLGLREGEADTMIAVAQGLRQYAAEHDGLDEEGACRAWAHSVIGLEHAHKLDPYVGAVNGIGPALFAYLRMRCGADALKPDVRVRQALNEFGYDVPDDTHAILTVARGAAAELGTDLLVLDQLLWWTYRSHRKSR
jgi:hypothetical protein